ncbi:MAG: mechanosensitive ion channel family protein [Bacteroidales bacterium]|nr:mechanosensitive ion channel family protein [Bacteroidales bacterium]MDD3011986.1 mechanosensitive ion channel family protein [Bacteroidales bacterium]MDD3961423.1 mechanosensitive ion channel family protein [Bacteroidales bacterium]
MRNLIESENFRYFLIITITLLIAIFGTWALRVAIDRYIKFSSKKLNSDPTKYKFLKNAVSFLVYAGALIFIFISIPALRTLGVTLFAGAGVITAIILFASQAAFANIISGIFIVIFKPFKINDIVDIGTLSKGRVEDITLRHTVIRNFENRRLIIPNSVISNETITNSDLIDEKICNFCEFMISYDSDMNRAMSLIAEEARKHPDFIDGRTEEEKATGTPDVMVRVTGFGESSVNLRAYVWSADHTSGFRMKCDLYKSVKERFDQQGIEIPFPYRTIVLKNNKNEKPWQDS